MGDAEEGGLPHPGDADVPAAAAEEEARGGARQGGAAPGASQGWVLPAAGYRVPLHTRAAAEAGRVHVRVDEPLHAATSSLIGNS